MNTMRVYRISGVTITRMGNQIENVMRTGCLRKILDTLLGATSKNCTRKKECKLCNGSVKTIDFGNIYVPGP